jgi:hypothetical protein
MSAGIWRETRGFLGFNGTSERTGIVRDQIPLPLDTKAMCNLRSDIAPDKV